MTEQVPRSKWKRRVVRLGSLLLLGTIFNVAVAWGFAAFHPKIISGPTRIPLQGVFHWTESDSVWVVTLLAESGTAHLAADDTARTAQTTVTRLISKDELPQWSRFNSSQTNSTSSLPEWTEMARGWPMYSMSNRIEENCQTGQRIVYRAIRIPIGVPECSLYMGKESFLPLTALWPGFAFNTIFYATIVWLLFLAPLQLRHWRRIKRGLCPVCAYPIGSNSVCTECGKPVRMIGAK